jgi:hypothetical protein
MPSFTNVNPGDLVAAFQVQQIIDALAGTPAKGVPLAPVALSDASNYALTIENLEPTNSRALSVLKSDGTLLIRADINGVVLGSATSPVVINGNTTYGGTVTLPSQSVNNSMLGPDVARANLLTNGGFEIWQRGNGPFAASGAWGADRWLMGMAGSDTLSISKNTTAANLDGGSLASAACTFTLSGGGGASGLSTFLKTVDGSQIGGRSFSFSVRVKTTSANAVRAAVNTDGTGGTTTYSSYHSGGGSFETLTVTVTVPTDATTVRVYAATFWASCTAYLDNAMLVVGSVPATYVPLYPADELARCLRYYEVVGETGGEFAFNGYGGSAGGAVGGVVSFKARKAVTPTTTKNGTWTVANCGQPVVTASGVSVLSWHTIVTAVGGFNVTNAAATNFTAEANP